MGDEQPNVIAEKVNLGRALTALDLEQVVLNNGVIPNSPLMERAALVKGMLQGMLDEGAWQSALQSVYTPQTTVRTLFDGDYDKFKKDVIASAAARKETTGIERETFKVIWENWTPDEVYELAMQGNINEDSFIHVMESLTDKLSDDKKRQAHLKLAERYIAQDNAGKAYVEFMRAGAVERADNIVTQLLGKTDKYDLTLALRIAESTPDVGQRRTRVGDVVRRAIQLRKGESRELTGAALYELVRKRGIELSESEYDKVEALAAEEMSEYDIDNSKDDKLRRRWALQHRKDRPGAAYMIFKSLQYEGAEALEAARSGLLNNWKGGYSENINKLSVDDVREGELRAILGQKAIPLGLRADIAEHLTDKKTMRKMSRDFYKHAQKTKDAEQRNKLTIRAYCLWFNAEGSATDSYMNNLRAELVVHEVEKERKAYFFWLDHKDVAGHRQAYAMLLERNAAFAAYNMGMKIYRETKDLADAALVQTARERAAKKNPELAFKHFSHEKDAVGVDLAIAAIGEKYKLSPGTLKHFLDHVLQ